MLLYLAGSFAGIVLLVALNVALFGRARPHLGSTAEIGARLAHEVAGFRAGRSAVASDGRVALIENAMDHSVYLLEAMGDDAVTRKLTRGLVKRVERNRASLSLQLADFSFPRATLGFDDEELARDWEARLKA